MPQLVAGSLQIALVNPAAVPVPEGEGQAPFVAVRVAGSIGVARPDPVPLFTLEIKGESLRLQAGQPGLPTVMQLTPRVRLKLVDGRGQQLPGQLLGQGRADPLIGLRQSFMQRKRQETETVAPALEAFCRTGGLPLQGWWGEIGIAGANGSDP